ncbi:aminotransferase class I/II-fold pyridoxal phosphate-dependent enzyme [Jidongwangia harbinensis]|uniref:aminotransferase class I/II-fold pyridoxal phosphate-dependent enzyme n=1 Tax=Jidongwangia harbinensis TaxID=2878561 RepID=UPI001CD95066|nr:aminotransferase class I/II-fold pyridoxal phosphate-dependent enzyme [Jidongwangia harbinensis]MCA2215275.1 aminotransferase class I/II-fold pyridoxal phosphate-dependent enzyme [Jidongwangia harbinensis]
MTAQYQVTGTNAAAISASIEAGIANGDYVWGAALPPVRILADSLHVSPATVAKAYSELRRRGVVETHGRRGTRVRSRPAVASARSALRLPVPAGVLDLSAGEPDLALLPVLGPELGEVAAALGAPVSYGSAGVLPELVDAARERLAADGVPMADAAVTVTAGALDALERLLTAHVRPGDAVAVEDPGWANLLDLVAALGLRAIPVEVDDEGPLPVSLGAALRAGARAVVVTTRAQNPTGAAVTAVRATALRALLGGFPQVLVIEDDHAAELAGVPLHCLGPVTGAWAFVRSASKPFGPDLRIAVMAGDQTTVARVVGRMRIGSGWVSTILQRLLLRLWHDAQVTTAVAAAARHYAARRGALRDALSARGLEAHGTTGINVWVRVPDEALTVAALRDAGYAVAPGSRFRIATPPGVRITVSPIADGAVDRVADAVAVAADPAVVGGPSR